MRDEMPGSTCAPKSTPSLLPHHFLFLLSSSAPNLLFSSSPPLPSHSFFFLLRYSFHLFAINKPGSRWGAQDKQRQALLYSTLSLSLLQLSSFIHITITSIYTHSRIQSLKF